MALARRPGLLVLDEPLARLDPLGRHDFMASVMTAVAEDGMSVILSSHVLAELERVTDYLIAGGGTAATSAMARASRMSASRASGGSQASPGGHAERVTRVALAGRPEFHGRDRYARNAGNVAPDWPDRPAAAR